MKRWVAASLTSWLWRWTETWSSLTVSSRLSSSQLLSQFISPHTGRIYGRHITGERITEALNGCVCSVVWIKRFMSSFYSAGLCGRKQKEVSKAIKKAHSMGTFPSDEPFKVTFLLSDQMNQISCTKYHVNVWRHQLIVAHQRNQSREMSDVFLNVCFSLTSASLSSGFMSVTHKHPEFMKDPSICGIKHLD